MDSRLSDIKQAEIIEAFKSTSRYLDDLLNIDNPYFEGMVNRIYPPGLQLNEANTFDNDVPFLDLHLSISNGFVSSKIYDKRDNFDFDTVNFPFLDGDVPRSTSYGVYISQLIGFARVSSHVADFNARNKSLTAKLQDQDQDSLLVKRRNDNHSSGPVIRELVPSSHQRSELSNTILCIFSG